MMDAATAKIADSPLLPPDTIQRLQTAGKHIEQLQKVAACEGTGPEDYTIESYQQREFSLCEWLVVSGELVDELLTEQALRVCWLETGDAVLTAGGRAIMYTRPIESSQAFLDRELKLCREALESRGL